jgi:hypothetical protein
MLTGVLGGDRGDAATALANLPVKDAVPITGYDRTLFLPDELGNVDTDWNGCDQRNDLLARELTEVHIDDDGCKGGRARSPTRTQAAQSISRAVTEATRRRWRSTTWSRSGTPGRPGHSNSPPNSGGVGAVLPP